MIIRLTIFLMLMLPVSLLAQDDELYGAEYCADCHDQGEEFAESAHGKAMAKVDPEMLEYSCESCHGNATEHLEDDPTPENIVGNPGSEVCNNCHAKETNQSRLHLPGHQGNDVQCLSCHTGGHDEPAWDALLVDTPTKVCGDCHNEQRSASKRPFAHRDGQQPFQCDQCHSAHQNTRVGLLALQGKDAVCTDCHAETSGPFVFPHASVEVDGCSSCHQPHGSNNPRLLTRRTSFTLCLECHSDVPSFHDITDSEYRACVSCHSAVHGSNRDVHLFDR